MDELAVRVIAEQTARNAVRDNLRAQGVKLSYVKMRDIVSQARAWLAAHPEILAEAKVKAAELGYA
jgi:hypothetical protein